ncbi:EAL domain-containing protein [Helicovermis profundi]|uniref:EAL domain-containing protein n=1 Tax=Helicovermis profundi TaxID=3065157 RepID=A0AAU9EP03_9FIRM|nr:EAL domain-containing protein [Clostridia bacterium S502]
MNTDIVSLIKDKKIEILFQLVISPNEDYAAGIEALSRGISKDGEYIPASTIFKEAKKHGLLDELEKLLIYKALKKFSEIVNRQKSLLLFINISEYMYEFCMETDYISTIADEFKVPYSNIVFDINPTNEESIISAIKFAKYFRKRKFYICLDNIGSGFLNLDKILYISPDIIKINIFNLRNVSNDNYRKNLLKFIKYISENLGILLVAMGVETVEDVVETIDNNIQFMQGFYVSKPLSVEEIHLDLLIKDFHSMILSHYTEKEVEIENSRIINTKIINFTKEFASVLGGSKFDKINLKTSEIFLKYNFIENIWILNKDGYQVNDTIINYDKFNVKSSPIFNVYNIGSDFSSKEIFTMLESSFLDIWVTKPYKSLLTNNICIGSSTYVELGDSNYILCLNINYNTLINYLYK